MIERVVSGGQTGVDRAALDAALEAGVACGGWCPNGRRAEDGVISDRYPLTETESDSYIVRTRLNVRDSDGTLVLTRGAPTGGTRATVECARRLERPWLVIDFRSDDCEAGAVVERIVDWLDENLIRTLNVAGPRASGRPGLYDRARAMIAAVLAADAIR